MKQQTNVMEIDDRSLYYLIPRIEHNNFDILYVYIERECIYTCTCACVCHMVNRDKLSSLKKYSEIVFYV